MESTQTKKNAVELTSRLSPSAGILVAIAIVGFAVLFSTLTVVGILVARSRNRKAEKQILEIEGGHATMLETKQTPLPPPPDPSFNRYVYNPFIPSHDDHIWNELKTTTSPRKKPKQLVNNKQKSQVASVRETWPTASNTPLPLVPGSNSIKVNNFDVPGYEIYVDPKWPKRTLSRTMTVSPPKGNSPRKKVALGNPNSSGRREYKKSRHIRSVSETQLSIILKSTSERLKASNRHSLTRTTILDQVPRSPPTQPLPQLPHESPSESREQHLEIENVESAASSIYDLLQNSESPVKSSPLKSPRALARMDRSPAPSEDSLRVSIAPPTALSSPSRNKPKERRSDGLLVPFAETKELAELVNRKNQAPAWETSNPLDLKRPLSMSATYPLSLSNDPFFSETDKPFIPGDKLLGPRPLYIRKSNLAGDKLPRRPQSCMAPLQHTSGNTQKSPKLFPSIQDSNPFQWSTQDIVQSRSKTPTTPTRKRNSRRSGIIRSPTLSRSTDVCTVIEEQDITSPIGTMHPSTSNLPVLKSKSDSRPPSIATFNPALNNIKRKLSADSTDVTHEIPRTRSLVSGEKHSTPNPEEQLFARGLHQTSPKRKQHISTMLSDNLLPSTNSQRQLISFPPPNISPARSQPQNTRPTLPHISTIYSPPPKSIFMQHSQAQNLSSPLPPLLTIAGHLTGPRPEPVKVEPVLTSAFRGSFFSSPTPALKTSVALLKRMDSAITLSSINQSSITQQMDLNSQAVRVDTQETKARGRNPSSFLPSSISQKEDLALVQVGRGAGIDVYERRDGKRPRNANVGNEDMDFFLRQRGLASPTYKETKKLSLVKEVDMFHPRVKKQSFGGQTTELREGGTGIISVDTTTAKSEFSFRFLAVDPSTFSVSSSSEDSEIVYEPEPEPQLLTTKNAPNVSQSIPTYLIPPAKSPRRNLPQMINTAPLQQQEQEEENRLAKYAYSSASTPPPPTFRFIQIDPTPTTPTRPALLLSAIIPSESPQVNPHPRTQKQKPTQSQARQPSANANTSTITPSAPPPRWSSSSAALSIKSPNTSIKSRTSIRKSTSYSLKPSNSTKNSNAFKDNSSNSIKHSSSIYSSNSNSNSDSFFMREMLPTIPTPSIFPPARSHKRDSEKFAVDCGVRGRVRSFGFGVGGNSSGEVINGSKNMKKVPEWVWSFDGLGLGLGLGKVDGGRRVSGFENGDGGEWDANCGGGSGGGEVRDLKDRAREKERERGSMNVYVDGGLRTDSGVKNINTRQADGEGGFF